MKCINCGHEWEADEHAGVVTCPVCGLEAEYLPDDTAYEKGLAAEKEGHFEEAEQYYARAAEEDIPCAALAVWRCILSDPQEDPSTMRTSQRTDFWLRTAAEQGDPIACYSLYQKAERADREQEALHYLQRSAEGRHAPACLKMARRAFWQKRYDAARYYLGLIADTDRRAAFRLFWLGRRKPRRAEDPYPLPNAVEQSLLLADMAEKYHLPAITYRFLLQAGDDPEARYRRAMFDLEGRGRKRPFADIRRDLEEAAEAGHPEVWMLLGRLLHESEPPIRDDKAALTCLRHAADAGIPQAWMTLGEAYYDGSYGERNVDLSLDYFRRAAAAGDKQAAARISQIEMMLREVLDRARKAEEMNDAETAFALRRECADRGHTPSCLRTAAAYLRGIGVGQSFAGAACYYKKAAEGGSIEGIFFLGMLYAQNCGVRFDYHTAVRLLTVAAEHGYPQGREMIDKMTERRRAAALDRIYSAACALYHKGQVARSTELLIEAARRGHARAMYRLGCHLEYGEGIERDQSRAAALYRAAAEAGYNGMNSRMKCGFLHQRRLLVSGGVSGTSPAQTENGEE